MAVAVNGTLSFVGASGKGYSISMYTADTAAYKNKFSAHAAAVAGSSEYWRPPESVTLVDFSMTTGTTQTHMVMTQDGAVRNGTILGFVPHVSTAATRPPLRILFPAGALIGADTL